MFAVLQRYIPETYPLDERTIREQHFGDFDSRQAAEDFARQKEQDACGWTTHVEFIVREHDGTDPYREMC